MSATGVENLPTLLPGMLPRLWAFSLRLCGNQHDAEDVLQRACVRGLERAHQLQPGTAPLSWMFSIVHSTWINELRARNVRSRSSMEWDDNFLQTVPDPAARTPEQNVLNGEIIAAVERLPEAQRIVMLLVAVEGLSYAEAADVLEVPIGTIMSRLSRARQTIGARFGPQSGNGNDSGARARTPQREADRLADGAPDHPPNPAPGGTSGNMSNRAPDGAQRAAQQATQHSAPRSGQPGGRDASAAQAASTERVLR